MKGELEQRGCQSIEQVFDILKDIGSGLSSATRRRAKEEAFEKMYRNGVRLTYYE